MSAGRILLIVFGVILVLGLMGGCAVYNGYNQAITLDEGVKSQWAQVENQLQRRFELIPNLVQTVKGYSRPRGKDFSWSGRSAQILFSSQFR